MLARDFMLALHWILTFVVSMVMMVQMIVQVMTPVTSRMTSHLDLWPLTSVLTRSSTTPTMLSPLLLLQPTTNNSSLLFWNDSLVGSFLSSTPPPPQKKQSINHHHPPSQKKNLNFFEGNTVLWLTNRPPMAFSANHNCLFALTFNFDWRIEWNHVNWRNFTFWAWWFRNSWSFLKSKYFHQ